MYETKARTRPASTSTPTMCNNTTTWDIASKRKTIYISKVHYKQYPYGACNMLRIEQRSAPYDKHV